MSNTRSPGKRPSVLQTQEASTSLNSTFASSPAEPTTSTGGGSNLQAISGSSSDKSSSLSFDTNKDSKSNNNIDNFSHEKVYDPVADAPSTKSVLPSVVALNSDQNLKIQVHDRGPSDCSKYDICIAIPMANKKKLSADVINLLEHFAFLFGMECMYLYESLIENLCFLLIRGSITKLKAKAEKDRFTMLLDPVASRELLYYYNNEEKIEIPYNQKISKMKPYDHLYARYRSEIEFQSLYWRPEKAKNPFSKSIRLKLMLKMICDAKTVGGANVNLDILMREKIIAAYYPMHDQYEISDNFKDSFSKFFRNPYAVGMEPMVREYFGEKVALVFTLYDHLITYISLPLIIGIIFQILLILGKDSQYISGYFYSFFLMIWSIFLLASWKQSAAAEALKAGTLTHQINDIVRPDFGGEMGKSIIDGSDTLNYPSSRGYCFHLKFLLIISVFVSFAIAAVVSLYIIKKQIELTSTINSQSNLHHWVISIITGGVVFIGNYVYYYIAMLVTSWEHHRTVEAYKKNLSIKVALFQFVNNFGSFYYLSFVAPFMGPPISDSSEFMNHCGGPNTCVQALYINLVIVYGAQIVFKNFCFYLIPYFFTVISKLIGNSLEPNDEFNFLTCFSRCCCPWAVYDSIEQSSSNSSSSSKDNSNKNNNSRSDKGKEDSNCFHNCFKNTNKSENNAANDDFGVEVYELYGSNSEPKIAGALESVTNTSPSSAHNRRGTDATADDLECMPELNYYLKPWDSEYSNNLCFSNDNFTKKNNGSWLSCNNLSISETVSLYAEIGLSLGYLLLFCPVFPGVAVFFWIDIYMMRQRHAWRLFHIYRRPIPEAQTGLFSFLFKPSENIIWGELFKCLVIIAFVTNSGLLFFVLPAIQPVDLSIRVWLFFGFQMVMLIAQYIMSHLLPEVSDEVRIQWYRSNFVSRKLIDRDINRHNNI